MFADFEKCGIDPIVNSFRHRRDSGPRICTVYTLPAELQGHNKLCSGSNPTKFEEFPQLAKFLSNEVNLQRHFREPFTH